MLTQAALTKANPGAVVMANGINNYPAPNADPRDPHNLGVLDHVAAIMNEVRVGQMARRRETPSRFQALCSTHSSEFRRRSTGHLMEPGPLRAVPKGERRTRRDDGSDMVQIWRAPDAHQPTPAAHFEYGARCGHNTPRSTPRSSRA